MVFHRPCVNSPSAMVVDERPGGADRIEQLLASAQFKHLVLGFEKATGLTIHAYNMAAVPQTVPFEPPRFCETLQEGLECPLYFNPNYHAGNKAEIKLTCGGL